MSSVENQKAETSVTDTSATDVPEDVFVTKNVSFDLANRRR